ncbi:Creatinase/aminopeptidase [Mycena pura]|uniref:Creatinase/aminopeptidase n=1 Tax=Mycena pura TaxID=153505 RepID=A0AAD6Y952_9AGAR|nr:Creatinase/aminopeptidase [Mycena pura]
MEKDIAPPRFVKATKPLKLGTLLFLASLALYTGYSELSAARAPPSITQHCAHLDPIAATEFQARQDALAKQLAELNASAYIAEPGASSQFYGNFSSSDWRLSERPLLLVITPERIGQNVKAKISILTPAFEADRSKTLPVASKNVTFIEWAEEASPYTHALSILSISPGTVFVDGQTRTFIVDGLREAHPRGTVSSAPYEIKRLRERKSPAELELLKCANEAALLSIRAVHKQLQFGIRESTASAMLSAALASAGLKNGGCLTLFGPNAALPHGSGTDRALRKNDFALFDCTGSLHGYQSDVTRTVALPGSKIPAEHLHIWHSVHAAQDVAIRTAREGVVAAEVDKAARLSLQNSTYFTHRLGHGIGLEVHEDPYLNGGSKAVLEIGHAFSDEPGIYILGKVGIRLEDCFYIHQNGSAVFLTGGVGGQARSPWNP